MPHPRQTLDHAPLLERAFALPIEETSGASAAIDGELPPFVRGTYLLNGPARFERAGLRYRHWLDGDGMVAALEFTASGARFSNRFVRSVKFTREEAERRPVFRTFGTSFAGDELRRGVGLESPANVSIYPYRGALLAFGEQGLPWELDPVTLETRGLHTFGGQLNEVTPFGAHPKIDPRTGELFNFGVSFSAANPMLNVFRFAPDGRLAYRSRIPLPYPASIHDFAASARHLIFYVSPLILDVGALLGRGASVMDALSWEPERGSQLLVVSRDAGRRVASIAIGHQYCLHAINAFEDGHLHVDVVEYDRPLYAEYQILPDLFTDTFRGRPVRFVIDPVEGTVLERREISYACSPDFPAHDVQATGRQYGEFWMLGIGAAGREGRKFFDQLVRVTWADGGVDVYQAPAGRYLGGEPAFVPEPGRPGAGVVMCQVFDAERVEAAVAVFDAFDLAAGPLATVRLPAPIPLLFHSVFAGARGLG